jgi:hypothetical protein
LKLFFLDLAIKSLSIVQTPILLSNDTFQYIDLYKQLCLASGAILYLHYMKTRVHALIYNEKELLKRIYLLSEKVDSCPSPQQELREQYTLEFHIFRKVYAFSQSNSKDPYLSQHSPLFCLHLS